MSACPKCSSTSARKSRKQNSRKLPRAWYQATFRCDDCGHRFVATNYSLFALWALAAVVFGVFFMSMQPTGFDSTRSVMGGPPQALESQWSSNASASRPSTDYASAFKIDALRAAVEDGDLDSQYELGMALMDEFKARGDLTTRDEALRWLREAASNDHPGAQAELGDLYMDGRGVVQDFTEAAGWYQKAAELGDPEAMYSLGKMAQSGWGIDENLVDAYVWLNLASARGDPRADEARNQVLALLSADALNDAQRRSRELDESLPRPEDAGAPASKDAEAPTPKDAEAPTTE